MERRQAFKFRLLTLAAAMLSFNLQAQELLTLEDAINLALENNYGIKIGKNEVQTATNNFDRGNAGFWPEVVVGGGAGLRLDNFNNQKLATGNEFLITNLFNRNLNASVGLQWTIFDGMRMFATYDRLRELQSMSELELRTRIEQLVYDVSLAYFQMVRFQLQIKALDLNLSVNEERVKLETARSEVGKGNILQVKQAKLDKNALVSERTRLQSELEQAKIALNRLLTRDLQESFIVADSIYLTDVPTAESLKQTALRQNTELQMLRKSIAIQQLTLKEQEAEKYPTVVLNSNYIYNQNSNSGGFSIFNNSLGLAGGLTVQWRVFDGGRVKRNVANTKLAIENERLMLQDSELGIHATMQQALTAYQNALTVAELEEESFQLATESLGIVAERFRLGVANTLELKDAQNVYDQCANRRVLALFDAKVAEINLRFLSGQMAVR